MATGAFLLVMATGDDNKDEAVNAQIIQSASYREHIIKEKLYNITKLVNFQNEFHTYSGKTEKVIQ